MAIETLSTGHKISSVKLTVTMPDGRAIACNTRTLQVLDYALNAQTWIGDSYTLPATIELWDGDVVKTSYELDVSRQPFRFAYGDFIEWVAYELDDWERLAPLDVNRYAEVHISYAHLFYYLTVRRSTSKVSQMVKQRSYSFHQMSFAARLKLMEQLAYSWTFSFEDSDWGHHYYNGSLEQIHDSLLLLAQGREKVEDVDQFAAFEGLVHLYRLAPDVMRFVTLSDIMFFATMTLPGYHDMLSAPARQILDLLKSRHEKHVADAYAQLASRVDTWLASYRDTLAAQTQPALMPAPQPDPRLPDNAALNKPRATVTPTLTMEEKLKIAAASIKPKPFGFK